MCLYIFLVCRERAAGYYATYPFALAQFLIEIPYNLVQSIFFSVITYFMIYFYIDAGESCFPSATHHTDCVCLSCMHHDRCTSWLPCTSCRIQLRQVHTTCMVHGKCTCTMT